MTKPRKNKARFTTTDTTGRMFYITANNNDVDLESIDTTNPEKIGLTWSDIIELARGSLSETTTEATE